MRVLLIALAVTLPAFAGCFGPGAEVEDPENIAAANDSAGAGAVAGSAPVGPSKAFKVDVDNETGAEKVTAHPVRFKTTAARAPLVIERAGTFNATDCLPTGRSLLFQNWRWFEFDDLRTGDVFSFDLVLEYENKDSSWGDLHLVYSIGGRDGGEYTARPEARGPQRQNLSDQGFYGEDSYAGFGIVCWSGFIAEPLAFRLTATFTFVESAIPAGIPIQIEVPPNATRLIVTGVPVDPTRGVLSHYRLFDPDDRLVCECALSSNKAAQSTTLPAPGDYVLLVDHTDNGFVSIALDAPTSERARPLGEAWTFESFPVSDGETSVKKKFALDFPRVPLKLGVGVSGQSGTPSVGAGKGITMLLANEHGQVVLRKSGGFVDYRTGPVGNYFGLPIPGSRVNLVDHHNFRPGPHTLEVEAEACRCTVGVWMSTYDRVI